MVVLKKMLIVLIQLSVYQRSLSKFATAGQYPFIKYLKLKLHASCRLCEVKPFYCYFHNKNIKEEHNYAWIFYEHNGSKT